tara:strand:+ start:159 stop:605 length:447 start_codon:yes stop_codon:yes gene_type:complete
MTYNQKEYKKKWYQENKERTRQQNKINEWKRRGLITDDFNLIYNRWINSTNCELCNHNYSESQKCMDHSHTTGEFRSICCNKCNSNMLDISIKKNNTSGHKNISFSSRAWRYDKQVYEKRIRRSFKSKIDTLCFKYIILLKIKRSKLC